MLGEAPTTLEHAQQMIIGSRYVRVMDQDLRPLVLYDLSRAQTPDSPETMRDHCRHFLSLRGKDVGMIGYDALQTPCYAFIRRWNRMVENGGSFTGWLSDREKLRADRALGAFREKMCENAWNKYRLRFVHVLIGCRCV